MIWKVGQTVVLALESVALSDQEALTIAANLFLWALNRPLRKMTIQQRTFLILMAFEQCYATIIVIIQTTSNVKRATLGTVSKSPNNC